MNQRELVKRVAHKTGKSSKLVSSIIESMAEVIGDTIINGEKVSITRLGTFTKKERGPRQGYDVYRGMEIQIPSMVKISFQENKSLKERLSRKTMS